MAINVTTLFTRLGKFFHAIETLNTARLTTVPAEALEAGTQMDGTSTLLRATVKDIPTAVTSWQSSGSSLASGLVTAAGNLIRQTVEDDNPQEEKTVNAALSELIAQMIDQSENVDASTVAVTVTAGGSNTGNGTLIASTKRGDGLVNQNILAESIESIAGSSGTSLTLRGEVAQSTKLSHEWPEGSGTNKSITAVGVAGGLLTNGGFETADTNQATKPASWDCPVATLGTTLKLNAIEVQTVAISGTPTAGSYVLHWVNAASKSQTTAPLAHNATSSAVQAALRALTGLAAVTVVESGTTPNLTHTISFVGVTNPAELTSTSSMTGGTPVITHGTTTAGSANVYSGARALEFDSDAAQLTQIKQKITGLSANGVYAVNFAAKVDVVPAAGVFTVDLYDGSAIINDDQGTANSFTFNAADLTTDFEFRNGFFRLPKVLPPLVYLRIRISTAISAGTSAFIDHVAFQAATELYAGGPWVAAFDGSTSFAAGDTHTLAVTNDRAGEFQDWFERAFNMREAGLLLPSDASGSETQADSLIA